MALKFGQSKGGAVKDRADSYTYKDGENKVRLVGDLLARYVYWIEGENKKNLPFECLAFDRAEEKFLNKETDHVKTFYPDMKCSWAYAVQCIDLATGELKILNLKKKLMNQILDAVEDLGDPTDPEKGWDVVFKKTKTGPLPINVEYSLQVLRCKNRALTDPERVTIKDLKSMDEVLPRPTADAQKELLVRLQNGGGEAGESIDDEINEEFQVK